MRHLVLATFLTAAVALPAAVAPAQQPGQAPPNRARNSVKLRTLGPGDILYVLIGGGGNSLALLREEGVVLIDTKRLAMGHRHS
jgi:hypothetical protein